MITTSASEMTDWMIVARFLPASIRAGGALKSAPADSSDAEPGWSVMDQEWHVPEASMLGWEQHRIDIARQIGSPAPFPPRSGSKLSASSRCLLNLGQQYEAQHLALARLVLPTRPSSC